MCLLYSGLNLDDDGGGVDADEMKTDVVEEKGEISPKGNDGVEEEEEEENIEELYDLDNYDNDEEKGEELR